jgi:peptidoglycan/LPS O-acetylase OafA/YrhL
VGGVLFCWVVWTAGALLAEAYVGRIRLAGIGWLVPLALVGLVVLISRRSILDGPPGIQAVAWGACLTILLGYLFLAAPRRVRVAAERAARSLRFLGAISYSLYLIHLPFLALLGALWLAGHDRLPSGWELFAPGVVGALALGSVTWFLVERHFVAPTGNKGPRERRAARPGSPTPAERDGTPGRFVPRTA